MQFCRPLRCIKGTLRQIRLLIEQGCCVNYGVNAAAFSLKARTCSPTQKSCASNRLCSFFLYYAAFWYVCFSPERGFTLLLYAVHNRAQLLRGRRRARAAARFHRAAYAAAKPPHCPFRLRRNGRACAPPAPTQRKLLVYVDTGSVSVPLLPNFVDFAVILSSAAVSSAATVSMPSAVIKVPSFTAISLPPESIPTTLHSISPS